MTTTAKKLSDMSRNELVAVLRRDVDQWNRLRCAEASIVPYLVGANLGGANLGGAYLGGAYLGGAYLGGAYLGGAYLRGANLGGAYLGGAYLGGANLDGADLVGANLRGANLGGAYLDGANLRGANLDGADLGGAYLRGANLGGANLKNATIAEHRLTGQTAAIGTVAGYEVRLFATTTGHILRAGCWTGTLDQAEARAIEEKDDALTRAEAAAVVAHGHAILAAWGAEA